MWLTHIEFIEFSPHIGFQACWDGGVYIRIYTLYMLLLLDVVVFVFDIVESQFFKCVYICMLTELSQGSLGMFHMCVSMHKPRSLNPETSLYAGIDGQD